MTDEVLEYPVQALITSVHGLAQTTIYWKMGTAGTYITDALMLVGEDMYEFVIPKQPIGATICYYLECEDAQGDVVRLPVDGEANPWCFSVRGTPRLTVEPTSLSFVLPPDSDETKSLELANTGTWPADWSVYAAPVKDNSKDVAAGDTVSGQPPVAPDWSAEYAPDMLLVGFKPSADKSEKSLLHAKMGAVSLHEYHRINAEVVAMDGSKGLQTVAEEYLKSDAVAYVEPNYKVYATRYPDDPRFDDLWAMENIGQSGGIAGSDISAVDAWDILTGSDKVIVAVIDTGIDYRHPDLLENLWVNPNPTFGDVHGVRWTNGDGIVTNGDPWDDQGHGTHCAGTIGAVGDNGIGVVGVNWNVRLMALKFLTSSGSGYVADAVSALEYAIDKGAHIASNSWGGNEYSQAMKDMIIVAEEAGLLFVAAAGNDSADNDTTPFYPASYTISGIVSVAAGDQKDEMASFSNYGATSVDLAAPGVAILSTTPNDNYGVKSGTSMATPHVAGAAALLLAMRPETPCDVLKTWLMDSVDVLPQWEGQTRTGGRLNVQAALDMAGVSWLEMVPTQGVLNQGSNIDVAITVNTATMVDGQYEQAQLSIGGSAEGILSVPVSLLVATGEFVVSPGAPVTFSGIEHGEFDLSSCVYTLRNLSDSPITWSVSGIPSWLDAISSLTGTLPGHEETSIGFLLNEQAQRLLWNTYEATLNFEDSTNAITVERAVVLEVQPPAPTVFYANAFDEDPGWTYSGEWDFGVPVGLGGEENGYPDPESSATGANVYGVNLSGDYERTIAGPHYLTTDAMDCTGYVNVHVSFQRWLNTDFPPYASVVIEASNDGSTWTGIWSNPGDNEYIIDNRWKLCSYDISAVADNQPSVYVRWGYQTFDGVYAFSGWNIDDVALEGVLVDDLAVLPETPQLITGYEGGPFDPASVTFTLINRADSPREWSVTNEVSWLEISPTNGDLAGYDVATVSAAITAEALAPGNYEATLVFTNLENDFHQERRLVLEVNAQPGAIQITDSIVPEDDLALPFGVAPVDEAREALLYLKNTDSQHDLVIEDMFLEGWYTEDFEDGSAQDWLPVNENRWAVVDGEYRAWAQEYETTMQSVYTGEIWQDVTVTARMSRTGSPNWTAFLIACASEDFELAAFYGSAYLVGVNGYGEYYVAKLQSGVFSWLQSWTPSTYLNDGEAMNVISLSINYDRLQVYANGRLLWGGYGCLSS